MASTPSSPRVPRTADVAVIGGGVVGVACALELARRGARVVVLERDRIGSGCSFGNAGWLTPSLAEPLPAPGMVWTAARWMLDPESPFHLPLRADPVLLRWLVRFLAATRRDRFERGTAALVELARASVDAWEELAARGPETFGFVRAGLVAVYETEAGLERGRAHAERVARLGIPYEAWSAQQVREREPAVRGPQVGGFFFPEDAHCEPWPAVTALAAEGRRVGAELQEHAEVFDAELRGGEVAVLHTTLGPVRADRVVLAAGAWSRPLAARLGLDLPVLGGKGYSVVVPPLDPHPKRSLMLAERKVAINPHADALRISGTLELVGLDLGINRRRLEAVVRGARGLLALPEELEVREVWRGLRPCTPDGLPVIGRSTRVDNLWLATGHQMTGLKTAPATGRLLAELMTGEPPSFDPEPFRADRW